MKQIATPYGVFNAYLNPLSESRDSFHISFVDKENKAHIIVLECICEHWIMVNSYQQPTWILKLLPQLISMVKNEASQRMAA